ncbi:MAG: NADH-quinone oxidoreductase subunit J [Gemmatimonadota bacterium]|nr:NADH-quinone oxidoreductase subunit J [Gemmatimonadota bacterium]
MNTFLYTFHFYLFGLLAIASALAFVTRKSAVAAALWLVNTMFCLSALYVMMDAQFLGAVQVLVYAGAIMVVFIFVVMLLNLGQASDVTDIRGLGGKLSAGLVGIAMLAELFALTRLRFPRLMGAMSDHANIVNPIAAPLFREYLLPFEVTSVVLLVAVVGAVVLAKRGPNAS